jgi:NADPH-dependent glutamate synthase beta subunit-like oxidoreductase
MLHLAIIGSGPAGYYTAEAAQKRWGDSVEIDIIDRLPVPFGLIRSGVAPDHQSIKAVARRYEAVSLSGHAAFHGGVEIGQDITVEDLLCLYDAVILATGAPADRPLHLPGDHLDNVLGSAAFVGWYNGHPAHAALDPDLSCGPAVVIGNGNVALDIARILAKTREEFAGSDIVAHALDALSSSALTSVTILGRRGPHQIAMTPKELAELAHLSRATPSVTPADLPPEAEDAALDPGQRKSVAQLRAFAQAQGQSPFPIHFRFFAQPRAFLGTTKVEAIEIEHTQVIDGRAIGTGQRSIIPASLVIAAIGYQTAPIPGVPYDAAQGRFANVDGRIAPGLYCVGWARRGPTGTIGTNRPDGYAIVDAIAADLSESQKTGRTGFTALAASRGLRLTSFADWQKIDAAEVARARAQAPREKFVDVSAMLAATQPLS